MIIYGISDGLSFKSSRLDSTHGCGLAKSYNTTESPKCWIPPVLICKMVKF